MPQWRSPSSVSERRDAAHAGRLGLAADLAELREALRRVRGRDRAVRVEPGPLGRAGDLAIGRDVLALAEERLVERVLELAQPALLAGPQARGQRQRRARLVARQVDLDARAPARGGRRSASSRCAGGRPAPRAAAAARAAARTAATRPRPRPRPRPPRPRATPCTSTGRRRRSRSGPCARECQTIRLAARCGSPWPRSSRGSPRRSGISTRAWRGSRRRRPRAPSCSSCPECAIPGYMFDSAEEALPYAEEIPGPSTEAFERECARLGVHAICGLLERDGDTLHNAAVLVGPDGLIGSLPQDAPAVPRRRPLRHAGRRAQGLRHAARPDRRSRSATTSASRR